MEPSIMLDAAQQFIDINLKELAKEVLASYSAPLPEKALWRVLIEKLDFAGHTKYELTFRLIANAAMQEIVKCTNVDLQQSRAGLKLARRRRKA